MATQTSFLRRTEGLLFWPQTRAAPGDSTRQVTRPPPQVGPWRVSLAGGNPRVDPWESKLGTLQNPRSAQISACQHCRVPAFRRSKRPSVANRKVAPTHLLRGLVELRQNLFATEILAQESDGFKFLSSQGVSLKGRHLQWFGCLEPATTTYKWRFHKNNLP